MKKEAYYFSHDANARNDVKCIKLRRELGLEGYGIFWCLIEMLRETPAHKLPLTAVEDIAFDLHVSKEKVEAVVMRYELFQIEETNFFSYRLNRSMDKYNTTKNILSEAGKKGNEIRWKSGGDRVAIGEQSQLKERKVKEKKKKEVVTKDMYRDNITLTPDEYLKLTEDYSANTTEQAIDYLSSYKKEKNYTTKSDYLTIKRWVIDAVTKKQPTQHATHSATTTGSYSSKQAANEAFLQRGLSLFGAGRAEDSAA